MKTQTNNQKVVEDLLFISSNKSTGKEVRIWFKENMPAISLDEILDKRFNDAIRETLKTNDIRRNYTIKEIESKYQDIVSRASAYPLALKEPYIKASLKKFIISIRSEIKPYKFVIPVKNLQLEKDFSVGGIRFFKYKHSHEKKAIATFYRILRNNTYYTTAQKRDFVKTLKEDHLKGLIGNTCAETTCVGKENRAEEIALTKVNAALDILKLYCLEATTENSNFGIEGEVLGVTKRGILQESIYGNISLTPRIELVGNYRPITLTKVQLHEMEKFGFKKMSSLLTKKRSGIERKILLATYWYARIFDTSIRRIDNEKIIIERAITKKEEINEYGSTNEQLVKIFVAFEALYTHGNREAIQNNIAERCALFLTKDYDNRKRIKKFIKDMYTYRSDIVHRGFTYVSLSELRQLSTLVRNSIIRLNLKKERLNLHSEDDLYNYFERQKLT